MGDDQAFDQLRNLYEEFGADDQDILLVLTAEDVFSAEVMNVDRDLWPAAAEVEGVERVYSIYSLRRRGSRLIPLIPRREAAPERYAEAKRMAMEHPLAVNQFVFADSTTLQLIARLAGDPESPAKIAPPVKQLRKLGDNASLIPGVKVLATGHPVLRIDILSALVADLVTFVAASAAVALLVAWLVFGRLAAVVIVVLTPTFGVFWMVSLVRVCVNTFFVARVVVAIHPNVESAMLAKFLDLALVFVRTPPQHAGTTEAVANRGDEGPGLLPISLGELDHSMPGGVEAAKREWIPAIGLC